MINAHNLSGFAQQADLHDPTATVREALEFSALLRQPDIYSRAEKLAYVDTVLELLDLKHVADALIGDENSGLGVEMTKRVTVRIFINFPGLNKWIQFLMNVRSDWRGTRSSTSCALC